MRFEDGVGEKIGESGIFSGDEVDVGLKVLGDVGAGEAVRSRFGEVEASVGILIGHTGRVSDWSDGEVHTLVSGEGEVFDESGNLRRDDVGMNLNVRFRIQHFRLAPFCGGSLPSVFLYNREGTEVNRQRLNNLN